MPKTVAPRALEYHLVTSVGLGIVCAACVVIALHDAFWGHDILDPKTGDIVGARPTNTALLLAVAASILILPRVRRFKFGDLELEAMQRRLGTVETDVDVLATKRLDDEGFSEGAVPTPGSLRSGPDRLGPPSAVAAEGTKGEVSAAASGASALPPLTKEVEKYLQSFGADANGDPNAGRFGGSPIANGREIVASARPLGGPSGRVCVITFDVRALPGAAPLTGTIRVYTHPTFRRYAVYDLVANASGVAFDQLRAAGAFTIGIVADDGATRLEYDLARVPGATEAFRQN